MTKNSILYAVAGFIIGGAMSAVVLTIFDKPDQSLSLASTSQSTQALPSRNESMAGMTASLTTKTGDKFDQAFLIDMIKHHQAAVAMAKLAASRAKHDEMKLGMQLRNCSQQMQISSFINDAKKTNSRMWNFFLICRVSHFFASFSKMGFINTAGKRMNIFMSKTFCIINEVAPPGTSSSKKTTLFVFLIDSKIL